MLETKITTELPKKKMADDGYDDDDDGMPSGFRPRVIVYRHEPFPRDRLIKCMLCQEVICVKDEDNFHDPWEMLLLRYQRHIHK